MEIKHLNFRYQTSNRKIFDDLNWRLDENNVHFIMGRNGSGKTTFYEIITNLLDYEGEIINNIDEKDILLQLQGVPMLKTIKGKDLAELYLGADGNFKDITLEHVMSHLPETSHEKFSYLWQSTYGNISVGERRWLIIYLLSLLDRELYIFDEPTAGLDISSAREILAIISSLSTDRGKKVLLTTHRMEEINQFNNYSVTFLHEGKNYFTGTKQEFLAMIENESEDNHLKSFLMDENKV